MRFRAWMFMALLPALLACSSDDTTEPANQPPTISFTFKPIAVGKGPGSSAILTVAISDPDADDQLVVNWTITRGALTPLNAQQTQARWSIPVTIGMDTVAAVVSDGEATASVEAEIAVGTLKFSNSMQTGWDPAGSPFILEPLNNGITTLSPGQTINMPAGIEILFGTPGGSIQVEGTLNLMGTAANPIVIRPNDRTLRCQSGRGWWEGIRVFGLDGAVVADYTEVWYGRRNVWLREFGSATLTNSVLRCGGEAGVAIGGTGSLSIDNCFIDNNLVDGILIEQESSTQTLTSVSITNSNISINGNTGIRMDIRDVVMNVPITVGFNRIEANFTHGIFLANSVFPDIHNNHFESNGLSGGTSNLWLDLGYPGGVTFNSLDCTNNFWGAVFADSIGIAATIRDRWDAPAAVGTYVLVDPWLNTSPVPSP